MRYLGIDFGMRISGIALSDNEERFAFPQGELTEDSIEALVEKLLEYADIKEAKEIVMGFPHQMIGTGGEVRAKIQELKAALEAKGLLVHLEDEMFTTKIAEQHSRDRSHASAAALILQSFLDRKNRDA